MVDHPLTNELSTTDFALLPRNGSSREQARTGGDFADQSRSWTACFFTLNVIAMAAIYRVVASLFLAEILPLRSAYLRLALLNSINERDSPCFGPLRRCDCLEP
jgi:hypothetical protein